MNAEDAFLQAALPAVTILLRQRLLPYSIGHEMILKRIKSPLLETGEITRGSLFTAVFVCCNDYDTAASQLGNAALEKEFEKWCKLCGKFELDSIACEFLSYVKAGGRTPDFIRRTRGGETPGAPFLLTLLRTLQGEVGFTRTEALNCPLGLANWYHVAHAESIGRVRIVRSGLDAAREEMKRLGLQPIKVQRN